jgi:hypothetical protein
LATFAVAITRDNEHPNQKAVPVMYSALKMLFFAAALMPGLAVACSCAMPGLYQDSLNHAENLFFGKIISAKANEEWVQGQHVTPSVTFEYRVEYVIRGKHYPGEVVKEETYPYATACARVPHIAVNQYFLSNGPIGNTCGLLVSPLIRLSRAEREIIELTEGGVEAVKWMDENIPDSRFLRRAR